jgi:hypothetical protein
VPLLDYSIFLICQSWMVHSFFQDEYYIVAEIGIYVGFFFFFFFLCARAFGQNGLVNSCLIFFHIASHA